MTPSTLQLILSTMPLRHAKLWHQNSVMVHDDVAVAAVEDVDVDPRP